MICYFGPYQGTFLGLFFLFFSRVLKQIQTCCFMLLLLQLQFGVVAVVVAVAVAVAASGRCSNTTSILSLWSEQC